MKAATSFIFVAALTWGAANSQEAAPPPAFSSPNYLAAAERLMVNTAVAPLSDSNLSDNLVKFAINVEDNPKLQARTLAIAWAVAGEAKRDTVIRADFYLRLGKFPEADPLFEDAPSHASRASSMDRAMRDAEALGGLIGEVVGDLNREYLASRGMGEEGETANPTNLAGFWDTVESAAAVAATPAMPTLGGEFESQGAFAGKQTSINGLLVIALEGSEYAGGASRMNATLVNSAASLGSSTIRFNQEVGDMMSGALNEAQKYLAIRHDGIPGNGLVEISFEERHSIKDGPSAAVACTLLIDSLITGKSLDPDFAVTGDMNADGAVQPVGGIDGKIRGAIRSKCSGVAVPSGNIKSISDIYITEGPGYLGKIPIYSIATFEDALALAASPEERSPEVAEAMAVFAEVSDVLNRPGGSGLVSNSHVQQRLARVLELMPNHESAKFLRLAGMGRGPVNLSLGGSFVAIDRCAKPMITYGESRDVGAALNEMKNSINDLRRLRNTLDPRTKAAADALEDLFAGLTELGENNLTRNSPRFNSVVREIDAAIGRLNAAYDRLETDPEVQEELSY